VFKHRIFAYQIQQNQRKKKQSLVIRAPGQLPIYSPVLDSQPEKSHSCANRISLIVSLAIHTILFLLAFFYVIDKQYLAEESHFVVDIAHYKPQRPKTRRRLVSRPPPTTSVQRTTVVPHVQHTVTTAAQIPVAMGESMLLPTAHLSIDEQHTETNHGWQEIRHGAITIAHQASNGLPPRPPTSMASTRIDFAGLVQTVQVDTLKLNSLDMSNHVIPLSEATQPPRFIYRVVPKYPPLAKRIGKEGVVILTAEIGIDGEARNIAVVQRLGYGCDEAAIAALRAARFSPAYKGENLVIVRIQIPYRFKMGEI